jgi:hypothetical protein
VRAFSEGVVRALAAGALRADGRSSHLLRAEEQIPPRLKPLCRLMDNLRAEARTLRSQNPRAGFVLVWAKARG